MNPLMLPYLDRNRGVSSLVLAGRDWIRGVLAGGEWREMEGDKRGGKVILEVSLMMHQPFLELFSFFIIRSCRKV